MRSQFNQVFYNTIYENTQTIIDNISSNTNNVSSNILSSNALPSNNISSITNNTNPVNSNRILKRVPDILRTLKTQSDFWSGNLNASVSDLINLIDTHNTNKRLNALYGIVDYKKTKHPILHIEFPNTLFNLINKQATNINNHE